MRGGMPSDRSIKGNSDYKVQTGILYFVIPAGRPPAGGPGGPGGPGFSPRLCGASRCLKHRISVCHHHRAPRIGSTRFACQNGGVHLRFWIFGARPESGLGGLESTPRPGKCQIGPRTCRPRWGPLRPPSGCPGGSPFHSRLSYLTVEKFWTVVETGRSRPRIARHRFAPFGGRVPCVFGEVWFVLEGHAHPATIINHVRPDP